MTRPKAQLSVLRGRRGQDAFPKVLAKHGGGETSRLGRLDPGPQDARGAWLGKTLITLVTRSANAAEEAVGVSGSALTRLRQHQAAFMGAGIHPRADSWLGL